MANKIALVTDLHFGVRKNSEVYFDSQKNFLINQLIPYLKENNITKIFLLGDIFDNRNNINTKVQNDVFHLFDDYFKDFEITILVGNHDCYFNSSVEINSIKFLGKFKNIKIVSKPKIIECYDKKILLAPWIVNFSDFIAYINNKTFDVSFGHYNIKGFHYNKIKTSEDGLDGNIFKDKCTKVFSGHFHIRSKHTYGNCDIIYIGSPYQLNRGDIEEERGATILNMDDLSYEYINNKISMKFIKIEYPKPFKKILITGNIIDVHIKYDKDYIEEKIDNYIKQIEELNPAFPPQIIIETDQMLDSKIDVTKLNFSSIPDLMMEYINTIDIKNKNDVYSILLELYNAVK